MRISELDSFKESNPNLSQLPTAPNFRLKGTGWYETDFKTGKKKNLVKEDKDKPSKEKKESKKKTESKKKIES